jgi:DNA helicase-2/ATP-dependent DNA helicase PcrA
VFLPGWEEGLFPNQRALDDQGRAGLEEERRLAHVGITRARRRAKISFATNRRMHGTWSTNIPSRFLDELPEAHVEVTEAQGGFGGYGGYGASRFDEMTSFGSSYTTPGWQRAQANHSRFGDQRGFRGSERGRKAAAMDTEDAAEVAHEKEFFGSEDDGLQRSDLRKGRQAGMADRFSPLPESGSRQPEGRLLRGGARPGLDPEVSEGGPLASDPDATDSPFPGVSRGAASLRQPRAPLTIEGELVAKSTGTVSAYVIGDRVFHLKFGNGNVTAVEGNKLTIAFDKAGEKRVVDSFVERV